MASSILKCGIDLGGSKLAFGIVNNSSPLELTHFKKISLSKVGLEVIPDIELWLEKICDQICSGLEEWGQRPQQLNFALPGKIIDGVVQSGTTPQFQNRLDDVNVQDILQKNFQKKGIESSLLVANDALAQLIYGCYFFEKDLAAEQKNNSLRLGYIGPGTGLGGGFAQLFFKDGKIQMLQDFTDGHIGDLQLPDGRLAEKDLLSGLAVKNKTGRSAKEMAEKIDENRDHIKNYGISLFEILKAFKTKNYSKARVETQWTQKEKEEVSHIHLFLIGGSLGTQEPFASIMLEACRKQLRQTEATKSIKLFQMPETSAQSACMGACFFERLHSNSN